MRLISGLLAVAVLLGCNMALAASKLPWYFGLRFGDDMDKRLPTSGGGALDSERPLGATFGYNFREHFAVEGSISDLGRSELTGIADGGFALEGNVFTVGIVAQTDVADRFSVFGGIGGFRLQEDGTANTIAGSRRFDIDQSGFYVEGGARFKLNDIVHIRGSYQWFDFDQDSDGTPWLGAEVSF